MKLKHFLLTALILFTGVGGVYATSHYVGFANGNTDGNDLSAALGAAYSGDTVFVAVGLYLADATEFTVKQNVTLIGGYAKGDIGATTRRYPGQFVPFDSSNLSTTTKFTILDGNAYKRSLPAQKHRVVTVNAGGVVDGCLIRNGHVRNKNGGGVLLNGGKLYNSIVRGNVAMNHPDSAEALGGGVFIQAGGELVNCLVAYNMANDGYGVAAGQGGGKMINNTITANTYSPVFAKIPGTEEAATFQMYKGNNSMNHRPAIVGLDAIPKLTAQIKLSDFYLSRILTTEGQYAVFCAAMDIPKPGVFGQLDIDTLKKLQNPVYAGTIEARYAIGDVSPALQYMLSAYSNVDRTGLNYADGVWFPIGDTSTVEYPMGNVTWYGALAYTVWLGGGLPTEAQWEYAARRNSDGTLSENLYSGAFGSSYDASFSKNDNTDTSTWRVLDTIAWVDMAVSMDTSGSGYKQEAKWGPNRAHEIARKRPNAIGIYDMTGNVHEWLADRFNGNITGEIYNSGSKDPIVNPGASNYRMYRGGAWSNSTRKEFSLTYRNTNAPTETSYAIGFRPIVAF